MNTLTWTDLQGWIAAGRDFMLVDVRESFEHRQFNIGGQNIPLGRLAAEQNLIPSDKDVVIYCQKGIRSVIGIQKLEALGYTNLYNLSGGVQVLAGMNSA